MQSTGLSGFFAAFVGLVLLGGLFAAGCSRNGSVQQTAQKQTQHAESEPGLDSEPESSEETAEKEQLAEDLFQLMKTAEAQSVSGKFDEALASWRTIYQQVGQKYGMDAWQTVSAELALNAARQRTGMSVTDRQQAVELGRLTGLASQLINEQKYNEARIHVEKAADLSTRLWGKESYVSANVNFIRAQCYLGLGLHDRALAVLNDVANLRITLTGVNHPDVESTLELLAKSNSILKNHVQAQQNLEKLVGISKSLWGEESEIYAKRCNDLAASYNNDRKAALAMPYFEIALRVRRKLFGDDSIQVGHVRLNRGLARVQLKSFDEAMESLEAAYRIFHQNQLTAVEPSWAILLDQLGTVSLIRRQNEKGQKYFSELADHWEKRESDTHLEYGKSLFKLSVSIGNQGKYTEAEPIMKRAITIFETELGLSSRMLHQPLTTYARLLDKMGVESEAQKIRDRAVHLAGFQELPR